MNEHGKTVDTTYLSLDKAEERGFIHRDYIAHCLRWTHVIRELTRKKTYETATIVDVGCGREVPLAKTMYSSRLIPASYDAIDYGPIPVESRQVFHSGKFPIRFWEHTDFVTWSKAEGNSGIADVAVCFEVLEHVEPKHMLDMLRAIRHILKPTGTAYISTPCWDVVSCAANHVNEMRYETLGAILEREGFIIKNVYGTFASIRDIEPYMADSHREVFNDLRSFYDVNYLATILAPFYPQYSRNCLWEICIDTSSCEWEWNTTMQTWQLNKQPRGVNHPHKFAHISTVPEPWSSSKLWRELA